MSRLIDADELLRRENEAYLIARKYPSCVGLVSVIHKSLQELLSKAPTVDAKEVKHGYDTGRCRIFHCSECGYGVDDIFQSDEHNYPVGLFNYCPNCGIKVLRMAAALAAQECFKGGFEWLL